MKAIVSLGFILVGLDFLHSDYIALAVGAAGGATGTAYVLGRMEKVLDAPVAIVYDAALSACGDLFLVVRERRKCAFADCRCCHST